VELADVDEVELTTADERKAIADSELKFKHDNYLTLHCAFNHNEAAIARARADKSFTFANVKRPPDFACPSCAAASNSSAKFSHGRSAPDPASLVPFHDVEIDVWGPFDAGDPVGNRYAFLGIDRATGKRFFQPMPRKSGCVVAMQQYMAHVKSLADKVEFKHNMQKGSCAICVVHSDRGGEFTTTYGFTRSTFDELLLGLKHEFNTPDTPQTGTTMVERSWGPLSEKARVLLLESGLKKRYYFYAMEYAADCMNLLGGCESNKMEPGQAPDATLGLNYDLGTLVPFGSPATLTTKSEAKNADVTKAGVMLGLNQSGKGYRVLLWDRTIVTSETVGAQSGHAGHPAQLSAANGRESTKKSSLL